MWKTKVVELSIWNVELFCQFTVLCKLWRITLGLWSNCILYESRNLFNLIRSTLQPTCDRLTLFLILYIFLKDSFGWWIFLTSCIQNHLFRFNIKRSYKKLHHNNRVFESPTNGSDTNNHCLLNQIQFTGYTVKWRKITVIN